MRRRDFLALTAAASARLNAGPAGESLIMITAEQGDGLRKSVPKMTGRAAERISELKRLADAELSKGPWNVTSHRPPGATFDVHEYYSEGPYFWPDPKNPNGPYIRKDGQRNPARFLHNRNDLGSMCEAVFTLGLGAYLFDDVRYVQHAALILREWFLDPQTRMNADLEHGQAVRGVNDGRGTGLIDTVSLIHCAQGIMLLDKAGKLDAPTVKGLRDWFAGFLEWMTTSAKGKAEGKSGNNHATWWTAQVAAYATLTGNSTALNMAWDRYRSYLVPEEIQPDGKCPREEARTNSLSYSAMNADAFATICRIAKSSGVELWDFVTPKGISYEKVVRYVGPYLVDPGRWTGQQISPFKPDSTVFLGLAGVGMHAPGLLASYKTLPRADSAWVAFVDLIIATS